MLTELNNLLPRHNVGPIRPLPLSPSLINRRTKDFTHPGHCSFFLNVDFILSQPYNANFWQLRGQVLVFVEWVLLARSRDKL